MCMLCKRQVLLFFVLSFSCVIWKMKHQLKSRFVASDLAWLFVLLLICSKQRIQFVQFFLSSIHYFCCCKKYFNEFSTPFLTLFRKWSIIKKLQLCQHCQLWNYSVQLACMLVFFLLCCVLEISFEAYMLSRRQDNAQVCLKFSQIFFIQLLTAFLQPPTSVKLQIQFNLNSKNDRF